LPEFQPEGGAAARVGLYLHCAFQAAQHTLHDIHTHTPPGNLSDLFGSAEPWLEDQVQNFRFAQLGGCLRSNHSLFDGSGFYPLGINALAIVSDFHNHLVGLMVGLKPYCAIRGFARPLPFLGALDTVADRIAN